MQKVLVVGAGWSGIYAAKHLKEAGFEPEVFEKSHSFMGQWHEHNGPGGVIRNTHATSSIGYMHPSDFPFPPGTPDFPHHTLVFKHIENYIKHFELEPHIHYEHTITKIEKINNKWQALINNNFTKEYDFVVVATGLNKIPKFPEGDLFSKFEGETIHSHYFKKLPARWKNKTVLIVGGGETAADIANEICDDAKVILSINGGVWFQDRILGAYEPADMFFNRAVHFWFRWWANAIFSKILQIPWGVGGSGILFWKPHSPYLNGIYNKSRNVIHRISEGQVTPKSGIEIVNSEEIRFKEDKEFTKVDTIIFGTGYDLEHSFEFLPKEIRHHNRYKHIFIPEDSTIAFVGFVRPFLGSIPMLTELQTRFVADVFGGKVQLPQKSKMEKIITKDKIKHIKAFPEDGKRVPFLVDPYYYCTEIGHYIGASPKLFRLFFTNFILYLKLLTQPWAPFQWRIHDKNPEKRKAALAQVEKLESHPVTKTLRTFLTLNLFLTLGPILGLILGMLIAKLLI